MAHRLLQQRLAAGIAHQHTGRCLVARCHIEKLAAGGFRPQHQPLVVDMVRHQLAALQGKRVDRLAKTGILNADPRLAIHQQLRQHAQRVLRAKGNQDLVIPRRDAALREHPGAQLLDQHRAILIHLVQQPVVVT